jgi:hypothetical protein
MIRYERGDLLQSQTVSLVDVVNCHGVMGKSIAYQFKEAFPENDKIYREPAKVAHSKMDLFSPWKRTISRSSTFPPKITGGRSRSMIVSRIHLTCSTEQRQSCASRNEEYMSHCFVALSFDLAAAYYSPRT